MNATGLWASLIGLHALAVLIALALDAWLGEPPARVHPVVAMGRYLGWSGRVLQGHTRQAEANTPDWRGFWLGALA